MLFFVCRVVIVLICCVWYDFACVVLRCVCHGCLVVICYGCCALLCYVMICAVVLYGVLCIVC